MKPLANSKLCELSDEFLAHNAKSRGMNGIPLARTFEGFVENDA